MGVAFREASSVRRPRRIGGWSQEPQEHKEAQDETLSPSLAFARSQTPSSIGQVGAERSDWLGLYDSSSTTTYKSIVVTMPPAKIMRKSNVETSMAGVCLDNSCLIKAAPLGSVCTETSLCNTRIFLSDCWLAWSVRGPTAWISVW